MRLPPGCVSVAGRVVVTRVWSRRERRALRLCSWLLWHLAGERAYAQVAAGLLVLHHRQVPPHLARRLGYVTPPDRVPSGGSPG